MKSEVRLYYQVCFITERVKRMSNYNNIKPYAEFSKKVAPFGGPDKYLQLVAEKNFAAGVQAEKATEPGKAGLGAILILAIFGGSQLLYRKYKESRQKKAQEAMSEANASKNECIEAFKEALDYQNADVDISEQ